MFDIKFPLPISSVRVYIRTAHFLSFWIYRVDRWKRLLYLLIAKPTYLPTL